MTAKPGERPWWEFIASRDFRGWEGLPPELPYARAAARFPTAFEGEGTGMLGNRYIRASFRVHSADGYPRHLRIWFLDDRVVLIDIELPELSTPTSGLLDDLGRPAAELDRWFGVLRVPAGHRVYPERGAAVFVGPEGQVLDLQLFPRIGLSDYQERLQPSSELTERF